MSVQQISATTPKGGQRVKMTRTAAINVIASKARDRAANIAKLDGVATKMVAAFQDTSRKFTKAQLTNAKATLASMGRATLTMRIAALRHTHTAICTNVSSKTLTAQVEDLAVLGGKIALLNTVVNASLTAAANAKTAGDAGDGTDLLQIDENGYVVNDQVDPVEELPGGATDQAADDLNYLDGVDPAAPTLEDPLLNVVDPSVAADPNAPAADPALAAPAVTDPAAPAAPAVDPANPLDPNAPTATAAAHTATDPLQPTDQIVPAVEPMNPGVPAPADSVPVPGAGEVTAATRTATDAPEPQAAPAPTADPATDPLNPAAPAGLPATADALDPTTDINVDDPSFQPQDPLTLDLQGLDIDDILSQEILFDDEAGGNLADFEDDQVPGLTDDPTQVSASVRTARRQTAARTPAGSADTATTEAAVMRALMLD